MDLNKALKSVMSTGKVLLGYKQAKKALLKKSAKMIIVSSNCPPEVIEDLKKYNVPVVNYNGTNVDLGAACGKPFTISALVVIDPGESNILTAATGS
ncbi:MAG: 50S ribosomal protein L30e [Thermoplasmata archaeon]